MGRRDRAPTTDWPSLFGVIQRYYFIYSFLTRQFIESFALDEK